MWTMKAATLVSAGSLSALAGFLLRDYQLFLLGILFISFIAVNGFFRPKISVRRPIPYFKVFEGDHVDLYGFIRNEGKRSALVEVYDSVPSQMRMAAGENRTLVHIAPGEEAYLAYSVEAPLRGHYVFGPVLLRRRDYSYLFFDEDRIDDRGYLSVYPRLEEVRSVPIKSRYLIPYFGTIGCRRAGLGSEFFYIRDYVIGDAFKRINWKASVRHQKWMVNEYEKENLCDVMLFVDARAVTGKGSTIRNPLEYSVKAAVSIGTHLLKNRNSVGLVTYNDEVKAVFPSIGEKQVQTITSALVGTYARGDVPLQTAVEVAMPHLHPHCTCIVITTLDNDPTLVNSVRILQDRGYEVIFLCPSLLEIEKQFSEAVPKRAEMIMQERDNLLMELRAHGAVVMDWDVSQPLFRVLERAGVAG